MKKNLQDEIIELKRWDITDKAEIETDGKGIIYKDICVLDENGDSIAEKVRIITEHGEAAGYLVLYNSFCEDESKNHIKHYYMEEGEPWITDSLNAYMNSLPKDYAEELEEEIWVFLVKGHMISGNTDSFISDTLDMAKTAIRHSRLTLIFPDSSSELTEPLMKCKDGTIKPILISDTSRMNTGTYILAEID